jgi:hypothetical protein
MDSTVAAAAASLAPSRAATPRQPMGSDPAPPPAVVPLGRLEQQLAADIGPPHNYIGFPTSFLAAAAAVGGMFPVAAQEGGDQSMPAAAAGLSGEASVRLGTGGLPNSSTASATAAAAAAAVSQGSGMVAAGSLLPELSQLLAAAEVSRQTQAIGGKWMLHPCITQQSAFRRAANYLLFLGACYVQPGDNTQSTLICLASQDATLLSPHTLLSCMCPPSPSHKFLLCPSFSIVS